MKALYIPVGVLIKSRSDQPCPSETSACLRGFLPHTWLHELKRKTKKFRKEKPARNRDHYCWYCPSEFHIPRQKVFRLPKLTPKPLAEGIGAYGLLMFQKLRGPFTKLMLATRLSHWSPRFCFFFRRSKFGSFPWGSWLGVFEMVGSLGVVGSSVSEWFPWLCFSSSTDRCLTETAVSFFRRIFPWRKYSLWLWIHFS